MALIASAFGGLAIATAIPTPATAVVPGPNGKIAFVSHRTGNWDIFLGKADGSGTPVNLTKNSADDTEPVLSPDGTKVAFVSDRSGNLDVWVGRVDGTGTAVDITKNPRADHHPSWSPDGTKVTYEGSDAGGSTDVWVTAADGASAAQELTFTPNESERSPSWSPDGTKIAFSKLVDYGDRHGDDIFTLGSSAVGGSPVNVTQSHFDDEDEPAWSPAGARMAFRNTLNGVSTVVARDGAGNRTTVSRAGGDAQWPAWSPDGTKVAFAQANQAGTDFDVLVGNADGTGTPEISFGGAAVDGEPDWGVPTDPTTPTTGVLAFTSTRTGDPQIWVAASDGSGAHNVTNNPAEAAAPAISPDGKKIAYFSDRSSAGQYDLYVASIDGSNPTGIAVSAAREQDPVWSPDGSKLAFARYVGTGNNAQNKDIFVANADGTGTPKNLTNTADEEYQPDWSPDGSRIAFTKAVFDAGSNSYHQEVWVMSSTTGSATQFTNGRGSMDPAWSPDGSKIAFASEHTFNWDIWVKDFGAGGGGSLFDLTPNPADDEAPAWSPDGSQIAFQSDRDVANGNDVFVTAADRSATPLNVTKHADFDGQPDWGVAVDAPKVFTNTAAPTISGTAKVGSTLTASDGSWSSTPDSFSYVWNAGGTVIDGATSKTYVPVAADVGKTITVTVTAKKAGFTDGSATSDPTSAVAAADTQSGPTEVYRFWSATFNNAHFLTANKSEADNLKANDPNWTYEGVAFKAMPTVGGACGSPTTEVYRFFSATFASHFYTASKTEADSLKANDPNWNYEGVAYCAFATQASGTTALYRFWSPVFGKHFFTANKAEADGIRAGDTNWTYEGIAYYVLP